ncbi:MAG: hypothetical protein AAFU78_20285, partial [Cyanobacteria bacterium J06633_2]
ILRHNPCTRSLFFHKRSLLIMTSGNISVITLEARRVLCSSLATLCALLQNWLPHAGEIELCCVFLGRDMSNSRESRGVLRGN